VRVPLLAVLFAGLAVALPTAKPALKLTPAVVAPGGAIAVNGSGFRPGPVVLAAGPPQSEADPFATVRADARGRFARRMSIHADAEAGPYVLLACQDGCRIRASAR
jgi:hypothetical protein